MSLKPNTGLDLGGPQIGSRGIGPGNFEGIVLTGFNVSRTSPGVKLQFVRSKGNEVEPPVTLENVIQIGIGMKGTVCPGQVGRVPTVVD